MAAVALFHLVGKSNVYRLAGTHVWKSSSLASVYQLSCDRRRCRSDLQRLAHGAALGPIKILNQCRQASTTTAKHVLNRKAYPRNPPIASVSTITSSSSQDHRPIDNMSHAVGTHETPLDERSFGQFWSDMVSTYPESPALVVRHEPSGYHSLDNTVAYEESENGEWQNCLRWNYAEMDKHVEALARGLVTKLGLKKGDRVGAYLGNGSAYACLQWATAKIGAILVCINPTLKGPELLSALSLTECKTLFISPSLKKSDHFGLLHDLLPSLLEEQTASKSGKWPKLTDAKCPTVESLVLVDNTRLGVDSFAQLLKEKKVTGTDFRQIFDWDESKVVQHEAVDNDDVINLQFTSGTTGRSKAVSLTHRNLLNNGIFIGDCMRLQPPSESFAGEKLCNTPPLYHCFGLVLGNLAVWTHGGCIVYASESFEPSLALRAVHLEKCTALHGVPTMFISELALVDALERGEEVPNLSDLGKLDFSSLRTGIAAGSPVPDEIMRDLIKKMNLRDLTITYGMSETSPATAMSTPDTEIDIRCRTVGQVLPHTSIRIVDPHHPDYPSPTIPSLPVGQPGELWSAGYPLMKGYWGNDAETKKVMVKDEKTGLIWIATGDQAVMDENGYISIVGRIKDIIIRGGENLFPVVIENRALLMDGIADCSIVAVSDPVMGEVVGAFVQRENSAAGRALKGTDLAIHIKNILSHQSAPDWVWFLGEDGVETEYPKTASGKIRKVDLRQWAEDLSKRGIGRVRGKY